MSRLAVAASLLITALAVGPAVAAGADRAAGTPNICSTRANVLKHLARKYSETPVALGVAENGGVIELLTSAEGSTWTIIITMPDGRSCMVAAGERWEELPGVAVKGSGA
jgi:hypothetical protein